MKNTFEIRGKLAIINIFGKGEMRETVIDLVDLPLAASIPGKWYAAINRGTWYVQTNIKGGSTIQLHKYLLHPLPEFQVDHWDHDGLNNRRKNLRITTQQGNRLNLKGPQINNTSGYRGVFFEKSVGKYRAELAGKYLGVFTTKEEAASVFDSAFKKLMKVKI